MNRYERINLIIGGGTSVNVTYDRSKGQKRYFLIQKKPYSSGEISEICIKNGFLSPEEANFYSVLEYKSKQISKKDKEWKNKKEILEHVGAWREQ